MTKVAEVVGITEESFEAQLPKPVGYRVLIALPTVEETFDGTELLKTNTIKHQEYRLMNDDSVEAVVADPSGIQRA